MTKFITPVAMACTLEQFATDLLQPLLKLGYKIAESNENPFEGMLIAYHAIPGVNTFRFYKHESWVPFVVPETTHLQEYNPELFLALAAMTDAEYGVAGEWWVKEGLPNYKFTQGKFYESKGPLDSIKAFVDNRGELNGFSGHNLKHFRKATKEELINKFADDRILRSWGEQHLAGKPSLEQVLDGFVVGLKNAYDKTLKDAYDEWFKDTFLKSLGEGPKLNEGSVIRGATSVDPEKPYEPKNGDKVMGFDHEFSSAVPPREGTYIGWDAEEKRHIIKEGPRRVRGYLQVEPVPAEPEITFEPGELVWVKYSRFSKMYSARYYARQNGSNHAVFNNQMQSGDTTFVTEIHKFDKRPF